MDSTVFAAWAGVGVLSVISIGGWVMTYSRNGKTQAKWTGKIEAKVDILTTQVDGLNHRVDELMNSLRRDS